MHFIIAGNIVDIQGQRIFQGKLEVSDGKITAITEFPSAENMQGYILPGFIDAHVHIESSMLIPSEFARLAVVHGTVATVSDPHEIANVCGIDGINYMIDNGRSVPFKFYFGAPSCVPATAFESSGATINSTEVEALLQRPEISYLSEMMNFPGVLNNDEEVMKKITVAKKLNKPVDGHAPGLRGGDARRYIDAGISTDHECFTAEEALEKLNLGMNIIIREGSAAKNFEALSDLLNDHSDNMMFCSDDKHPDSLVNGHINELCARAVAKGIDVFKVLKAACVNPVHHYKMQVGQLTVGDAADFIVVDNLKKFKVQRTYIDGILTAEGGTTLISSIREEEINHFNAEPCKLKDLEISTNNTEIRLPVIEALDGQLITNRLEADLKTVNGKIVSDVNKDVLKIVVMNRYNKAPVAKAVIKNFGLKKGAIASSVAHDSHNIISVGTTDEDICEAINLVIENKGGISCVDLDGKVKEILALPVAGLMSNEDGYRVAEQYTKLDMAAKDLGSTLSAPFMSLSFMALLVIPHLKLSDKGLFDGDKFEFVS
ncbi:MAG: adenine deaminase [Ginsengibacter sp.]